jgi:hypothetical protein
VADITVIGFKEGLDTTKLPESTSGHAFIYAVDGHVTRGAEFEKRAAFVPIALPPGATQSLFYNASSLVVFGSGSAPTLPPGVQYQQLVNPITGTLALRQVLSAALFANGIFALAQFVDGSVFAYYNGTNVSDLGELRARTIITIGAGITAGSVSSIQVNGVEILGATIPWAGTSALTAAAIGEQINFYLNAPNYFAVVTGTQIAIVARAGGATANGYTVAATAADISITPTSPTLAGGVAYVAPAFAVANITVASGTAGGTVTSIKVNGVEILGATVTWQTGQTPTMFAATLVAQINAFAALPSYVATAPAAIVILTAAAPGVAANGFTPAITETSVVCTATAFAGGVAGTPYQTGSFVSTGNQKVLMLSGATLNFSALATPTAWFSGEAPGAGFINMSTQADNVETLFGVGKYQSYYAFFSALTTQIWYLDPDPTLNKQIQVLNNTGTQSGRAAIQFGDNDLFYVDESGVRSLKARDASNAAATNDAGVKIDTVISSLLATLTAEQRSDIISVINPQDKRLWLAIQNTIYVLSFFPQANIAAWTTYQPGFVISDMIVFGMRVYLRSGDTVYCYGGSGSTPVYDTTQPEFWPGYVDGGRPSLKKTMTGFDAACRGLWTVSVGTDPVNLGTTDKVATIDDTTYLGADLAAVGDATHFCLRFKGAAVAEPMVVGAYIIHYGPDDEGSDEA